MAEPLKSFSSPLRGLSLSSSPGGSDIGNIGFDELDAFNDISLSLSQILNVLREMEVSSFACEISTLFQSSGSEHPSRSTVSQCGAFSGPMSQYWQANGSDPIGFRSETVIPHVFYKYRSGQSGWATQLGSCGLVFFQMQYNKSWMIWKFLEDIWFEKKGGIFCIHFYFLLRPRFVLKIWSPFGTCVSTHVFNF